MTGMPGSRERIESRASFEFVRYANCWEDADVLCEALRPRPGARILSIASAGDNALALLAEGAEVVAADLSAAQLACLELRVAAFRRLDYEPVLGFLGARPATDRLDTYARLEPELSPRSRDYWRGHAADVAAGVIHGGRFERFFGIFRRRILPLIHSRRTCERLLEPRPPAARRVFYDRVWNNLRWRFLFRLFFSRMVVGRLGRDPEFFKYVEGSVSARILERARHALTDLPTDANPYLEYIVRGNFGRALPRYLRPERFAAIRAGLPRLTLHHGSIEEAAARHAGPGFDAYNLSDIFEYLDPRSCLVLYSELLPAARPAARLAYWNTLVPRRRPPELADRVVSLTEEAQRLHAKDLAFFYGGFELDEVR
jgi:S-adenosylmethionine-diacylglycerol 3-amino-3-carboxypropyl transferase